MSALSRIARQWAERSFGVDHVSDYGIRALRTGEEAVELMQALGVPKEKALLLVETVYARPVGKAEQELGGVLLTAAILCESLGVDYDEIFERELLRVLTKPPKEMAQRNQDKLDLGLTGNVPTECTRNHLCAVEGPCNGYPRVEWHGTERMRADRMWRDPAERKRFERETGYAGRPNDVGAPRYAVSFNRWALIDLRKPLAEAARPRDEDNLDHEDTWSAKPSQEQLNKEYSVCGS